MYGISPTLTPLAEESTPKDPYLKSLLQLPYPAIIEACGETIEEGLTQFDRSPKKPDKKEGAEISETIRKSFDLLMHIIADEECAIPRRELADAENKQVFSEIKHDHPLRKKLWDARQTANRKQFNTASNIARRINRHYYELNKETSEAVLKCLLYAWRDSENDGEAGSMMMQIVDLGLMQRDELRDEVFRYVLEKRFAVRANRISQAFILLAKTDLSKRDSICVILASAWIQNHQVPEIAKIMGFKEKIGMEPIDI